MTPLYVDVSEYNHIMATSRSCYILKPDVSRQILDRTASVVVTMDVDVRLTSKKGVLETLTAIGWKFHPI